MTEIQSKIAFDKYSGLKDALKQQGYLFLFIGKTLRDIRDDKLFIDLGYETFGDFLQDPELKQKPSTCYAYIRIYEYYVEKLEMKESEVVEVGMNRLQRLLPALKKRTDEEAKEIVSDIGAMTHLDYNQEVKERGLDIERPSMYQDAETGKWIIEFYEKNIKRIYDKTSNETIFEMVD